MTNLFLLTVKSSLHYSILAIVEKIKKLADFYSAFTAKGVLTTVKLNKS